MSYQYIFLDVAQKQYEEALIWYAKRSVQAAENFVIAVDYCLMLISNHPTRWRNEYDKYYELGVKKFPYTIIYSIEEDDHLIVVASIYHHKRNPKKKYKK